MYLRLYLKVNPEVVYVYVALEPNSPNPIYVLVIVPIWSYVRMEMYICK